MGVGIGKEEGMEARVTECNHCLKSTTPAHMWENQHLPHSLTVVFLVI